MPLYEFECGVCGHRVTCMLSINERDRAPDCTECANEGTQSYWVRMTRRPGAPAFMVNGFSARNGYSKRES